MTEVRSLRAYAEVTLGRQRSPAHESGAHMVPYLRAANVKDGRLDLADVKEMNFSPPEQRVFTLRPGDVLVTEGSGSLGSVGASAVFNGEVPSPACYQNTLLRLRPRQEVDARFLAWWCRHAFANGIFARVATGANIYHLSAERVRGLPVTYVPLRQQRAIADYLDTETARIDALIEKKSRLMDAVERRFHAWGENMLIERSIRQIPLMYLTDVSRPIVYGIVQAGPHVSDGVPYLKSGDVTSLDVSELSRTSPDIDESYRRARVRPGDIVMAMRASIGRSVMVPDDLPRANLTQGTARIAPAVGVDPRWLHLALRTKFVQEQCRVRAVGTTFKTLNIWDLRRIVIPVPDHAAQIDLSRLISESEVKIRRLQTALRTQVTRLREHRQALITAAVTGELEIPGAA